MIRYYQIERNAVFEVIQMFDSLSISEKMIDLFERKYEEVKARLIELNFGYELLRIE